MNLNDLFKIQDDNTKQLYLGRISELSDTLSGGSSSGSYLVSGGEVIWRGNLDFTIKAASYYILGTLYNSPDTDVTLAAADATNPRIDTFYVDVDGLAGVITGTPAADPQEPSIDPETQLRLTIAQVDALATTPTGVTQDIIYDENLGTPSEWDTSTNNVTAVDFADTADPDNGTIHIDVNGDGNAHYSRFTPAAPATINSTSDILVLSIKLNDKWTRNKYLSVQFYDAASGTLLNVNLRPGSFGLDGNNISTYQEVALPLSAFYPNQPNTYTDIQFLTIVAPPQVYSNEYQLDYIYLQNGISTSTGNTFNPHVFKNTIWVDGNGNDDTGKRGEFNLPFKTIEAAEDAAQSGDTIIVMPGEYAESNLGKNGITYYLSEGSNIVSQSGTNLFSDGGADGGVASTYYVFGRGNVTTATGRIIYNTNTSTVCYFTVSNLTQTEFTSGRDVVWNEGKLYITVTDTVDVNVDNWYFIQNINSSSECYFRGNYVKVRTMVFLNRGFMSYNANYTQSFATNSNENSFGSATNSSAYALVYGGYIRLDNGGGAWTSPIAPSTGTIEFEGCTIKGTSDIRPMIDCGDVSNDGGTVILNNCTVEVESSVF